MNSNQQGTQSFKNLCLADGGVGADDVADGACFLAHPDVESLCLLPFRVN